MKRFLLIYMGCVLAFAVSGQAETVVYDHFEGSTLNPAWAVTLDEATDWSYEVALSKLMVRDIQYNPGYTGWASVILSQEFDAVGDLGFTAQIGWDTGTTLTAMQGLLVALIDTTGQHVIWASYYDASTSEAGGIGVGIGSSQYTGPRNLPDQGEAAIGIQRAGGAVTIYWDGGEVLTGAADAPIVALEIWLVAGSWVAATFGDLSLDMISLEGTAQTPVENTTWGRVKNLY